MYTSIIKKQYQYQKQYPWALFRNRTVTFINFFQAFDAGSNSNVLLLMCYSVMLCDRHRCFQKVADYPRG